MRSVLVRAEELGGRWVSLGSDAARGIVVENLTADIDDWGPRSCSFVLRRRTDVPWPDIGALAPLEIFDEGLLVWSGRVKGTPTSDGNDRSITVNGEGWQYHLDDDVYQRVYVLTGVSKFVDSRSLINTDLNSCRTGGQVVSGQGVASVGWQNDYYVSGLEVCSMTLSDFVNSAVGIQRVIFKFTCPANSNNDAVVFGYARASNDPNPVGAAGGFTDVAVFTLPAYLAASPGYQGGDTGGERKYLHFFIYYSGGVLGAPVGKFTSDQVWQINAITAASATGWVGAAGESLVHASDVVSDALDRATLLLATDRSLLSATTFNLPEFAMTQPATPREAITAVNAYHAWQARVNADLRFEYRPLPVFPLVQVDQRSTFNEASSGDASEVYSGVLVTYTDAGGQPQTVARSQAAALYTGSDIQPTNPSAVTNTTGWSASGGGTLTRTTTAGQYSTAPGAFKLAPTSVSNGASSSAWTGGTFVAGQGYRLSLDARFDPGAGLTASDVRIVDGSTGAILAVADIAKDSTYHGYTLDWVAVNAVNPVITLTSFGAAATLYWDTLLLSESAATIVTRRGFKRTKILDTSMALTTAGATQIGDIYLENHRRTPLKGQLVVTGYGAASHSASGQKLTASELLLKGGELVRLNHLVDPDTGALGREGRIASASWDAASDTTTIDIDSQSHNFEAMLGRLALVTGQVA